MKCFECEHGEYFKIKEDYHTFIGGGKDVVVRDIEVLICDSCGSKALGDKANKKIDKAIEEYRTK